ncbi:MAG: isoprenylcysteine carboxyl methyltransferase [Parcubacteria group bacterium LiPW_30]|nr:MAG: isoprenylcysteine carboxyl methyltransferase [Parcubacteria group bacterium LiPW_30]
MSNGKHKINKLIVYSPMMFMMALLAGAIADYWKHIEIVNFENASKIGLVFMLVASALILWAGKSGRNFLRAVEEKVGPVEKEVFTYGPYSISRNPTYLGLILLSIGFSFVMNSLALLVAFLLSFFFVNYIILPAEEDLLEKKYGEAYREYKKIVRRWF